MSKYGDVALRAVDLMRAGSDAERAWQMAAKETFPHSPSSETKSCPRGAFLGLVDGDYIEGASAESSPASELNAGYAKKAAAALCSDETWAHRKPDFWRKVSETDDKAHNGQLDVVIALTAYPVEPSAVPQPQSLVVIGACA